MFTPQSKPQVLSGVLADRPSGTGLRKLPTNTIYHVTDTSPPMSFIVIRTGGVAAWRQLSTGASGVSQTAFARLAVDKTTNSAIYSTLISTSITTTGGDLLVWFSCSSSNDTNNVHGNVFAVFVDGVKQQSAGFTSNGAAHHECVAINVKVTGLAAGAYTVAVQWKTDGGTLRCTPLSDDDDSASMIIQEVIV